MSETEVLRWASSPPCRIIRANIPASRTSAAASSKSSREGLKLDALCLPSLCLPSSVTVPSLSAAAGTAQLAAGDNGRMAKTPAQRIKKHGAKAAVPQHHLPPAINPGTNRSPAKAQNNANLIVIAGVVASLFLFWYLPLLTLNQLTQLSGGLAMPDSLVGGFDTDYIEQLRRALNGDARGQLNYVHKTAGTLFPLIFA